MAVQRFFSQRHLYLQRLVGRADVEAALDHPLGTPAAPAGPGKERAAHPARLRLAPLSLAPLHGASLARLLAVAYEGQPESGCFAPGGALDQWEGYVDRLLGGGGFGTPLPDASFTASAPGQALPHGVILATSIAGGTAHIAQLAVAHGDRRRGTGKALVRASLAALARAGFVRVTLLVAETNHAARRLYRRLGFEPCGEFVFAAGRPVRARQRSQRFRCARGRA